MLSTELNKSELFWKTPTTRALEAAASSSSVSSLHSASPWSSEQLPKSVLLVTLLVLIDLTTILGNLLVVVSVMTTKTLQSVTNSFIVSLACADMLVAVLVMPLSIYTVLYNTWAFGNIICDLWISCDVMLCTASILNLCCISLDRYFAITRPLSYSRQRSPKLARTMITLVWISSVLISCPPVFGWGDKNREPNTCTLNLLLSYRIYSSMGSFYVPCLIMIFVYLRIFKVIHDREKYLMKSSSSNTTTFSMPHLNDVKKKKAARSCFRSFRERRKQPQQHQQSELIGNKGKNKSHIMTSQSLHGFESKDNNKSSVKNVVSLNKLKHETNINSDSNNDDDYEKDDEIINNLSAFINEPNNRNLKYSSLKPIIDGQKAPIDQNQSEKALTSEITADCENVNTNANPSRTNDNECNRSITNAPQASNGSDEGRTITISESEQHAQVASASCSSRLAKKSTTQKTRIKLFRINFKLFNKENNREAPTNPRIRPNNLVARKLANHNTNPTGSILATVTFMPNSRTKISSCLTISRSGSVRSLKSLRSFENNPSSIKKRQSSQKMSESMKLKHSSSDYHQHQRNRPHHYNYMNDRLSQYNNMLKGTRESPGSKSSLSVSSNITVAGAGTGTGTNNGGASCLKTTSTSSQKRRKGDFAAYSSSIANNNNSSSTEQMRLIKESKAAKTLAIVVGGFIVSWTPFFVMYVLEAILPRGYISKMLFDWLTWLGYFNSAINPVIYAFYSKQFRSAFYRLTLGRCRRGHSATATAAVKNKTSFPNYYYCSTPGVGQNRYLNGAKSFSFYNNQTNANMIHMNELVTQQRSRNNQLSNDSLCKNS